MPPTRLKEGPYAVDTIAAMKAMTLLRKLFSMWLKLPFLASFLFSSRIGRDYGVGFVDRLRLMLAFRRNSSTVTTLSSLAEHLELAASILTIPPGVPGDVVECGCYQGGCTVNLSLACGLVGRRLIVCDSFEGLPDPTAHNEVYSAPHHANTDSYHEGQFAASLELVKGNVARCGNLDVCDFIVGFFDKSLADFDRPVAVAFLDVDLVESLRPCLVAIWPNLEVDGRVYVHEAEDLALVSTFFDRPWWSEAIGADAPGLVGAGSGLPLAALQGSDLGYAQKPKGAGVPLYLIGLMAVTVEIVHAMSGLEDHRRAWDELAVAAGRPFCAPDWMLAWWEYARPEGAELRVAIAADDGVLVGVAPFWRRGDGHHEMLTSTLSPPVGPLLAAGREEETAAAMGAALADSGQGLRSLRIEDVAASEAPTARLTAAWPSRAWVHRTPEVPLPVVDLDGRGFDDWFATKSSKFRQETRRTRRRLEDEGATFVLADAAGAAKGIDAFIDLHGARRESMGGSNALIDGLRGMLLAAAAKLNPLDRMRIYTIEVEGRSVAANILLVAGHEVSGWNSGFDAEWARYSPSMLLTLQALADAAARGEARMSLGPGGGDYKRRLADREERVVTTTMVPHGSAYPLARLRLFGYQARWAISTRTGEETKQRLRRLRGRVG